MKRGYFAVMMLMVMWFIGGGACATDGVADDGKCTGESCQAQREDDAEVAARVRDRLAAVAVDHGVTPEAAVAMAERDVQVAVPDALSFDALTVGEGGGAKTNTVCTYQPNCRIAWADQLQQNRGCTQGCGGPAVCQDGWATYYYCGHLAEPNNALSECVLNSAVPTRDVHNCPDWYSPLHTACALPAFYINEGTCVRGIGEP